MLILSIETSCDETSAALIEDGRRIVSNIVASQIKVHAPYFGVVPELASRAHLENVNWVIEAAFKRAGIPFASPGDALSAIAYTRGPGLAGSLLVGQMAARTLASLHTLPLIDVNHLEGHLYASLLEHAGLKPPYLSLVVSGGHTELVEVRGYGRYSFLGGTRDDAAGEAFDKVAKLLNLGYPGGPLIDRLARKGNPGAVPFPRPFLKGTWDFSFSGLKTSVVNHVRRLEQQGKKLSGLTPDICASFQQAVIDTLIEKTVLAARHCRLRTVVLGGGVSANSALRAQFLARARREKLAVYLPSIELCTDNAAMIGCAAYYRFKTLGAAAFKASRLPIEPGMRLESWKKRVPKQ